MMEPRDLDLKYDIERLVGLPLEEKEKISLEMISGSISEANNQYALFSGGKRSLVLLHLMKRLGLGRLNVLHVETAAEFDNIINYIDKMRRLWGFNLINIKANNISINIAENRQECCKQFILNPLRKAIADHKIDCIYTGAAYNDDRIGWSMLEKNEVRLAKPISHFLDEDIWQYINKYNLPYCSLYREGYLNLDCEPCSRLVKDENVRAENKDEARIKESLRRLGYL